MFKKRRQRQQEALAAARAKKLKEDREARYKGELARWDALGDEIEQEIALCDGEIGDPVSEIILKPEERVIASVQSTVLLETRSVDGYPELTPTDKGTFHITNQRIVFQGEAKTMESLFAKLVGIQYLKDEVVVSVSNRQKATTVAVGQSMIPTVKGRIDVALADYRGEMATLKTTLELRLAEHETKKPKAPPQSA